MLVIDNRPVQQGNEFDKSAIRDNGLFDKSKYSKFVNTDATLVENSDMLFLTILNRLSVVPKSSNPLGILLSSLKPRFKLSKTDDADTFLNSRSVNRFFSKLQLSTS